MKIQPKHETISQLYKEVFYENPLHRKHVENILEMFGYRGTALKNVANHYFEIIHRVINIANHDISLQATLNRVKAERVELEAQQSSTSFRDEELT